MPSPELSVLLHQALEPRLGRLLELARVENWQHDPEGLHQVRVASRRVRAVLDLADPEVYPGYRRHERRLRRLTNALGATRELDVHLANLEAFKERDPDPVHEAAVEHVQELLERRRKKVSARELGVIPLEELSGLLTDAALPSMLVSPDLPRAAWECLEPAVRRLQDFLPSLLEQEVAEAMHRMRIQVKKLRYTLEILGPAFPPSLEDWLLRLKAIQTALGEHHDLATLEALLWREHARLTENGRATLATATLDLLGVVAEERRARFERFCALGSELSEAMLFFNLRQMLIARPQAATGEAR